MSKACSKCRRDLPLEAFGVDRRAKSGRVTYCLECKRAASAAWRVANPARVKARVAEYYAANREKARARNAAWRKANPEKRRAYYLANREKVNAASAARYKANPEKRRGQCAAWDKAHPEKLKAYQAAWAKANPEKLRAKDARRRAKPQRRIEIAVRCGVWRSLVQGGKHGRRTFEALGYTPEQLREHLGHHLRDGMTWDNYGKWHIDHIVPLNAFNYSTVDHVDFRRAWALSNLQPLWAVDNMRKGDRLAESFQPSLQIGVAA